MSGQRLLVGVPEALKAKRRLAEAQESLMRRGGTLPADATLVAFPQEGIWRDPGTAELMADAMRSGADVVGGMPHWEVDHDAARGHIEFCLDLPLQHDADVDMHVDETDDARWRTFELLVDVAFRASRSSCEGA